MKTHFKCIVVLIVMVTASACDPYGDIVLDEGMGEMNNLKKFHYNALVKSYEPEIVIKWHEALGVAVDNKMGQSAQARIYAMVTLAMHDALNSIVPQYETFALPHNHLNVKGISKENISEIADAAVSQSAHDVLVALFPAALVSADNLLMTCLSAIEDSPLKEKGITIGREAASAMLMKRQNDPAFGFVTYSHGTEPGVHQANYLPYAVANPPVWPANAAHIPLDGFAPFGIVSGNQFRPGSPYPINSPEYTADYNEVKKLGCTVCPDRTPEQTEIGAFWKENPSGLMNRLARALARNEKLNGWETARLQALIHMAQFDANLTSFESKYFYHYWLPVTAVRAGDTDGNDNTQGDASWTPRFAPPPTPDYVSTPAAALSSSSEIFKRFFVNDNISFTLTNPFDTPGVERSYTSFSTAIREAALARIYIGSHFRNSCIEGEKQGRKVGKYVFENNLEEIAYPY
jgi:hypothetical protein